MLYLLLALYCLLGQALDCIEIVICLITYKFDDSKGALSERLQELEVLKIQLFLLILLLLVAGRLLLDQMLSGFNAYS